MVVVVDAEALSNMLDFSEYIISRTSFLRRGLQLHIADVDFRLQDPLLTFIRGLTPRLVSKSCFSTVDRSCLSAF